jgi:hypothetical protein
MPYCPEEKLCFRQRYKKDLIYANGVFQFGEFRHLTFEAKNVKYFLKIHFPLTNKK